MIKPSKGESPLLAILKAKPEENPAFR